MSESFLAFDRWPAGILQASIPVNNNALRDEALTGPAISATTTAQPGSPAERDIYILPAAATGAQWATFDEGDVVIYYEATWTAYAPHDGLRKFVEDEGTDWQFVGDSSGGWAAAGGGGAAFTGGALTSALDEAKGADIASAGTTNIAAATGNLVHITGTTTITAFGTAQAGTERVLVFDGALLLTHHATSLILPTGANITTAAGDTALVRSEGSGNWRVVVYQRKDGSSLAGAGGLTGFTATLETASPNNTTNVSKMLASGGTTNQFIALQPKGNGGLLANVPDGTSAGGNIRGIYAVDWQCSRTNILHVASGTYSTISGGQNNRATASQSTVAGGVGNIASGTGASIGGGDTNTASATAATVAGGNTNTASIAYGTVGGGTQNTASTAQGATVSGGENNTASGLRAAISGGYSNVAAGAYSWIPGGQDATTRGLYGAGARSALQFATDGDAQSMCFVLRISTANATQTTITADGGAASTSNQVVLPNAGLYIVKGTVAARQNTTGDSSAWEFTAVIKRGANAAATAMVVACTPALLGQDAGAAAWALAVDADTTNGGLRIRVTGEAAKTIRWVCDVYSCVQVSG